MEEQKEEKQVSKQEHEVHHKKKPMTEKLRSNPWILSTVVLGIFAVILIVSALGGSNLTGNAISEGEAADIIVDFAEQQTGGSIELVGVAEDSVLSRK